MVCRQDRKIQKRPKLIIADKKIYIDKQGRVYAKKFVCVSVDMQHI